MSTLWKVVLVIVVSGAIGAGLTTVVNQASSQSTTKAEMARNERMAHLRAVSDDLIMIHRVIRLDNQGQVKGVPGCTDIITMKLLIDLYDQRGVYPILSTKEEVGKKDTENTRIYGLQKVLDADKVETGKTDYGDVPLTCSAVIMANRDSGPYLFGYLPIIERGKIEHLVFAARPVYGDFVATVHSGLGTPK